MNKYLMTWYGITDFRASLGLEQTSGPVLGALLADDYTDAVILGFTHPDKDENSAGEFRQQVADMKSFSLTDSRQFIDRFSNTPEAHDHFIQWLETELLKAEKTINIHFKPVDLKHLNDTEGIYEAATHSLNIIAKMEGERKVTLFLSPGTPVMAFVWAFAALKHPNVKKRLIASSQPGQPPEQIVLPNEWLEWHGKQVRTANMDFDKYDVIFHLFGEQRMPNLLGVIQFSSRKHIFVKSAQFPADAMKQFLGEAEYGEISVDPYSPENVRSTILDKITKMPTGTKIGFNLTGGTKLMYAGALAACRKVNATPFYFNSRNNQVIYLNDFKSVDTKLIPSVETYIQLNGNNLFISKAGHWEDIPDIENPNRMALTKRLWVERSLLAKLYKRITPYNDKPGHNFQITDKNISVGLKEGKKAEVIIKKKDGKESVYRFANWSNFAKYLSGGWFEEYVYMQLLPLRESGSIKDLRIGLEIAFKEKSNGKNRSQNWKYQHGGLFRETYQELDIAFTDGRRLFIIECKAGSVKGEQIRKLESIVRYFGGIEGKGILASCFRPSSKSVRQKIQETRNVELISGGYLPEELQAFAYHIGGKI